MIRPVSPRVAYPPRVPHSVRRVMHLDFEWLEAMNVHVRGAAHDEVVDADLAVQWYDESSIELRTDDGVITTVRPDPPAFAPDAFAGLHPRSGFGRRAREVFPADGSTLALLLDDIPGSTVASGYVLAQRREIELSGPTPADDVPRPAARQSDVCSGWRADGTMMLTISAGGPLQLPPAPSVGLRPEHDGGWPVVDIPRGGARRLRRIDVVPDPDGTVWHVDAWFRDAFRPPEGDTVGIHEYTLDAVVDARDHRILALTATPHVLPWDECPAAADSVVKLIGQSVDELRTTTTRFLTGIESCTHLSSELRALADLPTMVERIPDANHPDRNRAI